MKWKRSKYVTRYLVFIMLISTLPVILLGLFSFHLSSVTLLNNTTQSSLQLLEQTESGIEHNLKIVDETLNHFAALPEITGATTIPLAPLNFQTVAKVSTSMDYIHSEEIGIDHLYFFNLASSWAILPDRVSPLSAAELEPVRRLLADSSAVNWFENRDLSSPLSEQLGFPVGIFLLRKIPQYVSEPRGAIIASISFEQLRTWIATEQKLGSVYIFDKDNQLLAGSSADWSEQKLTDWDTLRAAQSSPQKSGYLQGTLNNETVHLFFYKSDYSGWTYVSLVPDQTIRARIRPIGWLTFFISAMIVLASVLLSMTGSRSFYKPIGRLMAKLRTEEHSHTSDEFEVIDRSMSRMQHQLVHQESELQPYLVLKLLHGELTAGEIPDKMDAHFPYIRNFPAFAVLAFQIDTLEGTRYPESDRDLLLFALKNMVEELIPRQERLPAVVMNRSLICLLGLTTDTPQTGKTKLLHIVSAVQAKVDAYLSVPVSIGVSRMMDHIGLASAAYCEAVEALKYRIRFGNNSLLFYEDMYSAQGRKAFVYPHVLAGQLVDAIEIGSEEEALRLLSTFIAQLFEQQGALVDYQMAMIRLLSEIVRLHGVEGGGFALESGSKSLPGELMELQTPQHIEDWFAARVIRPVLGVLKRQTDMRDKKISEQILQIVEQEFHQELTLEWIGTKLNYSPGYLSQIFRKEQGIPFTEFVTRQRVKMAKLWLVQTDMTINEIAEKLGYQNTQNLIRSFKKEVGITPGAYRKERHS